jgi:hypothetical protein
VRAIDFVLSGLAGWRYGPRGAASLFGTAPTEEEIMRKAFALVGASTVAVMASAGATAFPSRSEVGPPAVRQIRALSLEFVGQFQNSPPSVTPPTHVHYGYLSYIRGVSAFRGGAQNESTALFTFYADAATPRIIPNGTLRVVTRVGRLSIYRDPSTNGDFARPESFRDGTPVLVAQFRQQVVTDTVTGALTTFHQNRIVSTRRFDGGRGSVRLGRVGQTFRAFFSGHVTMPGPPSGFIAGYGVSG